MWTDLARCPDALPNTEVDDGVDEEETEREVPLHPSDVADPAGLIYAQKPASRWTESGECVRIRKGFFLELSFCES